MSKRITMKIVLACSLLMTGLLGTVIGSSSKASAATPESLDLLSYGKDYIGTPYSYGAAEGATTAFDCSSFVQYVFDKFGVELPRTSISQAYTGQKVDKGFLSVGDLMFFSTLGGGISHVGIYAGDGMMLHASSSKGVTVTSMETNYWRDAYVSARRVL
ncbi:C40 family peptidase [Cohnella lupini]|uniref:Cell wall-associated NlpC family hydrolase n=1 Tax=Cohnella lupini TaxID=1294267 RepID=A0A3D9IN58_9BACL|nr:C40 family peptidase [Cohnella lupini]RED63165.1 cell wall-associated NlpC family hydrolase [Cohnella lupini]